MTVTINPNLLKAVKNMLDVYPDFMQLANSAFQDLKDDNTWTEWDEEIYHKWIYVIGKLNDLAI